MTGAGAAEVAYAVESGTGSTGFGDLPDTPTWKQPGVDIEVANINYDNQMTRSRQPDSPTPVESRPGNIVVSADVSFTVTDTNFHELVFANSSNDGIPDSSYIAPTATWYFKSDLLPGTADRFPAGTGVESVSWDYAEGDAQGIRVTLSLISRDGEKDISTPSSISQPSAGDAVPHHGFDLDVNGNDVNMLQSTTLSISGLINSREQQAREAADMSNGAIEPSLQFTGIPEDESNTQLAYGSASATATEDEIVKVPATVTLTNSSGTLATYNLTDAQYNSTDWQNLVSEDNLNESPEAHVADVSVA